MLSVVCYLLCVVCCLLFVKVSCWSFVVLFVACRCCVAFVAWCVLIVDVCYSSFVVWRSLLLVVCILLVVDR